MILTDLLTSSNILIFVVFLVIVVLAYKILRTAIKAIFVTAAGFVFPWIVGYLELPLPITPDIDTGIRFATLALGIFLAYEFSHFIIQFLKILAWPFRGGKR